MKYRVVKTLEVASECEVEAENKDEAVEKVEDGEGDNENVLNSTLLNIFAEEVL